MPDIIEDFSGEYGFLSNFARSPFTWDSPRFGEVRVETVEHAYQAEKAAFREEFFDIACATSPGSAKKLGRQCHMRDDWEEVKDRVMDQALWHKFVAHPGLRQRLLDTFPATLIEGNTWHDNIWGVCFCSRRACAMNPGENRLGKALMKLRDGWRDATRPG